MHNIEPFYNWLDCYDQADDKKSPFYKVENNQFEYNNTIYNHLIHPQWDAFGSETLYLKVLFANYKLGQCIIEFIGEWNDLIGNDIMYLKQQVVDLFIGKGITKFILIGENILTFHSDDDSYYEEWFDDIEDGWIVALNFREHVLEDIKKSNIDSYIHFGSVFDSFNWRKYEPKNLFEVIDLNVTKRLGL